MVDSRLAGVPAGVAPKGFSCRVTTVVVVGVRVQWEGAPFPCGSLDPTRPFCSTRLLGFLPSNRKSSRNNLFRETLHVRGLFDVVFAGSDLASGVAGS